jgi:hypothetical protein
MKLLLLASPMQQNLASIFVNGVYFVSQNALLSLLSIHICPISHFLKLDQFFFF